MSLNELARTLYFTSESHGFEETPENVHTKLLLVVQEICEAQEELRTGHGVTDIYYNPEKPDKPEGFPIELADALIRILVMMAGRGINPDYVVNLKHEYNLTRPFKHGKQF